MGEIDDQLCLFIEILSGSNLLIRDKKAKSSDPYIKVKLNGKDVHQTKVVSKNLDPKFGDAQNNSFILDCPAKELFDHQGLLFKVKDHNRLISDEDMGSVQVPAMEIYKATGLPLELTVAPPSDMKGQDAGKITIRCWPATEAHLKKFGKKGLSKFVSGFSSNVKKLQTEAKESVSNIGTGISEKVQDMKMDISEKVGEISDRVPVPFKKKEDDKSEEEEADLDASATSTAKEININSLAPAAGTDDDDQEPKIIAEKETDKPKAAHVMNRVRLLVEVVAGKGLLVGDVSTSDPYVKVMLGDKEMHKTKHLTKTLNPVFTPELDSTFLLDCTDATLSDKNGLVFLVKDWDMLGGNEELGTVEVDYPTLITAKNGEAKEFKVTPPKGKAKDAGYLLIRWRNAKPADKKALSDKKNKKNLFATTTKEAVATSWAAKAKPAASPQKKTEAAKSVTPAKDPEAAVTPKPGEELHVKVEIVSARGCIGADKNGLSDPYVKMAMGKKDLHKTKHINKTLNPVFADMDNIFALHCPASDLFDAGGLDFTVRDWDRIGKNDELGQVNVSASKIYSNMNGQDLEVKINPPKGKENDDAGYLTIRCTSTTADDHIGEKKKFLGMTAPQINVPKITSPLTAVTGAVSGVFNKDRGIEIDENEEPMPMFIQIVSCKNLLVADKTGSSDPYVKVKLGKKDLHETKPITQTVNPVYAASHDPYFVMEAKPSEVRANGGLVFKVKDWDRVGKNDDLGTYTMDADTLYKCEGGNMEVKLKAPKGIGEDAGSMTIRCRPATASDQAARKSLFGGMGKKLSLQDYGPIDLHLLIEIVAAWQIPIADLNSSDPYVKVKIGPRDVHATKPIKNTREPVYTVKHNSVFVLDIATKELKQNCGATFKVKDYDMIGANDDLGEVTIPPETILEASGERLEFQLKQGDNDAGWLAIRVRPVCDFERDFLKSLAGKSKKDFMGLRQSYNKTMKPVGGNGNRLKALMTKMTKQEDGVKKVRVRPYPDPEREKATEFMPEDEIESEAFKPSRKWMDVGSGALGKIFVEILGCDGLPNKDHDLGGGNKTDPFVSVVYEDTIAKTDIIDDCLSPRWLPWMQRAFVLHMMHTSSKIHIGVFDFDAGFATDHDICGKVSIDLANLLPDTEYLLRYNLYENSVRLDRKPKGIIMVRLRMELKEERDLILSNLAMPPEFFVNVKDGKDFDLVRQTVGGRQDMHAYNKDTIQLYLAELMGYQVLQYYLIDSIKAILLWRGQVKFYGIWLPVHSFALFFMAVTLAERPSLYPSYWFFCLGWSLLSVQTWRNNSSNPWHKTKTFVGLTQDLLTGTCFDGPPNKIAAHENEVESKAEEKQQKERIEKAREQAEEYQKQQMQLLEEHESMMAQVGDQTANTDISTQSGGVSIDPLKFILYPIQQYLAMACNALRVFKNILIWDEPYITYIITLASFAIGIVFLIVPWAFLIRWTSRIVAWLLLGPHMKLVDIYYFQGIADLSEDEQREQIRETLMTQLKTAQAYAAMARVERENAVKLKDVKEALYGKFVSKIPVISNTRFVDIPLHSSTATPYKAPENLPRSTTERVPGQHLVGTMIPRILQEADETEAPAKEEESKKND